MFNHLWPSEARTMFSLLDQWACHTTWKEFQGATGCWVLQRWFRHQIAIHSVCSPCTVKDCYECLPSKPSKTWDTTAAQNFANINMRNTWYLPAKAHSATLALTPTSWDVVMVAWTQALVTVTVEVQTPKNASTASDEFWGSGLTHSPWPI